MNNAREKAIALWLKICDMVEEAESEEAVVDAIEEVLKGTGDSSDDLAAYYEVTDGGFEDGA